MSPRDKAKFEALQGVAFARAAEISRLRALIEFVSTDPCFTQLGTVTQDEVRAELEK